MSELYRIRSGDSCVETKEHRLGRLICNAARTRLDWVMGEKEWDALGFRQVIPGELPVGFRWTIYVLDVDGGNQRRVGLKIFSDAGLVDILEIRSSDATLQLSDREHQSLIDDEIRELGLARRKDEIARIERLRGFPAGAYELSVSFPTRNAGNLNLVLEPQFSVGSKETYEDIYQRVSSEVVVTGLHNYDLDFAYPNKPYAVVRVAMKRTNVPDVLFEYKVKANGYLAS